jgi:hypothetical protein
MSDLLFIGGASFILLLLFGALAALVVHELRELHQDKEAPKWLTWGLTSFAIAVGAVLLGVALKILENL